MTKTNTGGDKPTAESLLDAELDAAMAQDAQASIDAAYMDRVDPSHPVLSVEEQIAALKEADLAVTAEKRKTAKAELVKREKDRLMGATGLLTGDPAKDELVHITIDLAEFAPHISINGRVYYHGQSYKVPRHVADTLREQAARTHGHQNDLDGKGITERYRRPQSPVFSGKAA